MCRLFWQDIGYKGEIGYQTFLYSSEPEIRTLLMFLVEKLPRECAEHSDQPTGNTVFTTHYARAFVVNVLNHVIFISISIIILMSSIILILDM